MMTVLIDIGVATTAIIVIAICVVLSAFYLITSSHSYIYIYIRIYSKLYNCYVSLHTLIIMCLHMAIDSIFIPLEV